RFGGLLGREGSRIKRGYGLESRMLEEVAESLVAVLPCIDFLELLQAFLAQVANCHYGAVGMAMPEESRAEASANHSDFDCPVRGKTSGYRGCGIEPGSAGGHTRNQRSRDAGLL